MLIIYNGKERFEREINQRTPSLVNEVTAHIKRTTEGIISKLITHKPGVYSRWDITLAMKHRAIPVYDKLKGFLSAEGAVLLEEAASRTNTPPAMWTAQISLLCCTFNSCSSLNHSRTQWKVHSLFEVGELGQCMS